MSRPRTIDVRQLNVSMHAPHSPQAYVDLFKRAFGLRRTVRRGRADGYLLGALYGADGAVARNELQGEIYRFTNIDANAPWFNTQTGKPAQEAETERIVIPEHLHPNLERIAFSFRPREHRFWYVSRDRKATMGPSVAEGFLQQLFDEAVREHGMPATEVTVVPDRAAVDEVLNIHRLTQIIIEFKRPNADDAGDVEQRIMKRMEERKINRLREEMTSRDPDGIVADDELKTEARAAAHNGSVEAKGFDASGLATSESTRTRPARYVQVVNDALETVADVLRRVGAK